MYFYGQISLFFPGQTEIKYYYAICNKNLVTDYNLQSGLVYRDISDSPIEMLERFPYPHY